MGIPEYQVLRGGGGGAALDWSRQQLFGVYIVKLRHNRWRMYRGWQLDELQRPTLEAWRVKSLLFCHKIHCGTISIDKDKYLTPSQSTQSTRSSHNSQYCRHQAYSGALMHSFFPKDYSSLGLAPSVVAAKECRALI